MLEGELEAQFTAVDRGLGAAGVVLPLLVLAEPPVDFFPLERRERRWGVGHGPAGFHLAVTVEKHALLDEKRGRVDVALDPSWAVNFDRALGRDVAAHGSLDDDGAHGDLGIHLGAFAHDEHIIGEDLAGQLAVHADGAFER